MICRLAGAGDAAVSEEQASDVPRRADYSHRIWWPPLELGARWGKLRWAVGLLLVSRPVELELSQITRRPGLEALRDRRELPSELLGDVGLLSNLVNIAS